MAIPLIVGIITGTSIASLLTLITSTFVLQVGAPLLGVSLGITNPVIIITMFCFALGMVLAVFEICDSLFETSVRVQKWLENMEKAGCRYPPTQEIWCYLLFFHCMDTPLRHLWCTGVCMAYELETSACYHYHRSILHRGITFCLVLCQQDKRDHVTGCQPRGHDLHYCQHGNPGIVNYLFPGCLPR